METYVLSYTGKQVEDAIKLMSNSVAAPFSPTKSYAKGDVVVYDGLLYSCNADTAADAWSSTKWSAVKIFDEEGYFILDGASSSN